MNGGFVIPALVLRRFKRRSSRVGARNVVLNDKTLMEAILMQVSIATQNVRLYSFYNFLDCAEEILSQ
jgi:hypothetical protein